MVAAASFTWQRPRGLGGVVESDRVRIRQTHDDGVNAWETIRVAPPVALRGAIDGYAEYRERTGGFTVRRELPHAGGVLIVNLGDPIAITGGDGRVLRFAAGQAFVAGAHLRPALSQSDGAQAGIHVFLPLWTLRRLLRAPMHTLVDQVVPLDALLGPATRALGTALCEAPDHAGRVALLDATLTRHLLSAPPIERQQAHAIAQLRTRPDRDLAWIAREIGWSRKHLSDRVRDAVGVGPRCYRRLLRFQALTRLVGASGRPDWAVLAQDAGYCDQSHMIREFREFSGLTPSAYLAQLLPDGGGLIEA